MAASLSGRAGPGPGRQPAESAARALAGLHEFSVRRSEFDEAERYYAEGLTYTEGLELGVFEACLHGWHCWVRLAQGRWDEAEQLAIRYNRGRAQCLAGEPAEPDVRAGLIRGRRGDERGGLEGAGRGLVLATQLGEAAMAAPVHTARAELHWLAGRPGRPEEAAGVLALPTGTPTRGSRRCPIWLSHLGVPATLAR